MDVEVIALFFTVIVPLTKIAVDVGAIRQEFRQTVDTVRQHDGKLQDHSQRIDRLEGFRPRVFNPDQTLP